MSCINGCGELTELALPDSIEKTSGYFYVSEKIQKLVLPSEVKDLSNLLVQGKYRTTVYNGAEYLGSRDNPYNYLVKVSPYFDIKNIHKDTKYIFGEAFKDWMQREMSFSSKDFKIIGRLDLSGNNSVQALNIDGINFKASGCSNLQTVSIKNITTIPERCFYGCGALNSLIVDDTLQTIDSWSFKDCKSLKALNIPGSLVYIAGMAFEGSGLEKFDVPYGIETFDFDLFNECRSLKEVSFPKSIRFIDSRMFGDYIREGITVHYQGTKAEWNSVRIIGNYYSKNEFVNKLNFTYLK